MASSQRNRRDRIILETSIFATKAYGLARWWNFVNRAKAVGPLLPKLSVMPTTFWGPPPGILLVSATLAHQT